MSIDDIKSENNELQGEQPVEEGDRFSAFAEVNAPHVREKKSRLSASSRSLVIAIAIAASLALILVMITVFIPNYNDNADVSSSPSSDTSDEIPEFVLFDRSDTSAKTAVVQTVTFNNKSGQYTMFYDEPNNQYLLKGYEDLQLSQNAEDLIEKCIKLTADDKIDNAGSLADFGLDKPTASVTITYHDGSKATINIGNMVATEDGYYLNQEGSDDVYMVLTDTANLFMASDWWFVSTTLFTAPAKREGDEEGTVLLKELSISGRNHKDSLHIRRPMPTDGEEFEYYKYVTDQPYLRGVIDSVGDSFYGFSSLYADRAAILHPTKKQLNDLGFNDPYSVIDFTLAVELESESKDTGSPIPERSYYNNQKHRITIGCKDADGYYVIKVDDINALFLISSSSLQLMAERQFANTITSMLFLKKITAMSRVSLSVDGAKYDFMLTHYPDKEENNDKLKIKMDGKSYDTENFRNLYVLMMDLERYGKIDSCPTSKPDISLELILNDGTKYLGVDFYRQSGSLYKARTSDGEIFSITASSVNTLLAQVDNYLANKTVVA